LSSCVPPSSRNGGAKHESRVWLEEVRQLLKDARKMAMNVRNRDAVYPSADYCSTYSLHPVTYGNGSHYFPRGAAGPETVLKPPLNLMCQQPSQAFQPVSPTQALGPPPVMMPPDPLAFPLCSPLSAKPPPHLQLQLPSPPVTVPQVSSPQLPEEECQKVGTEQDATLEELCKPLYCKLCNVTLNSAQQAQAHYQLAMLGMKEVLLVSSLLTRTWFARNYLCGSNPAESWPGNFYCKLCDVSSHPRIRPTPITRARITPRGSGSLRPSKVPALPLLLLSHPGEKPQGLRGSSWLTENGPYCVKLCDESFSLPRYVSLTPSYQGKKITAKRLIAHNLQTQPLATHCVLTDPCFSRDAADPAQRRSRKEGNEYRLNKSRRTHVNSAMPGPYYNPRPRQRIPRDLAMCVTPSGQFYCSMCNSGASEEADFRLHLESKQHKSKVSEQRYRSEMENLGYT
ncbi:hypothetical protein NFI96_031708, partial [Prochilodus magdalenae]